MDLTGLTMEPYDYVIIHAGTNDIGYRRSFKDIISDYGHLIGICRKKKSSAQIVISAILPRPKMIIRLLTRVQNYSASLNLRSILSYGRKV